MEKQPVLKAFVLYIHTRLTLLSNGWKENTVLMVINPLTSEDFHLTPHLLQHTHRLMSSQLLASCVWMCEGSGPGQTVMSLEGIILVHGSEPACPSADMLYTGINQGYLIIHRLSSPLAGTGYASRPTAREL